MLPVEKIGMRSVSLAWTSLYEVVKASIIIIGLA
jgi:hypothetical protein